MNILLIDDHVLFGKSLEIALIDYKEIDFFCAVQNVTKAINIIKEKQIDILLVDINLGNDTNGLSVAKFILSIYNDIKVVMLTGYDLPVYRYEAKKFGAKGFLKKDMQLDELFKILIHIHNGYVYFPTSEKYIEELTEREKLILQYLCNGVKRKDMSTLLYVTERTVSNHIQHIFDKLDVKSSLEAVSKGIQLGYIQPYYKNDNKR